MYVMLYLGIFASGFILSAFFLALIRDISLAKRVAIKEGIPFLGSLAIYLAAFYAIHIFNFFSKTPISLSALFLPATLILILGLVDDFQQLRPLFKVLVQIIAAGLVILNDVKTKIVFLNPLFNIIVTVLWFLAITNAFNLLDIMDGLSGGIALVITLTFFVISLLTNNFSMGVFSVALAGSLFAFLKYNFPPAKIYMGNAGSLFIGFILAAISLSISYASLGREIALLTPLIILGLPIYDTAFVVLMRLIKGKSPIRKSKDHFALRLLALGYSKKEVLLLMYSFGAFFAVCAIALSRLSNFAGFILIAVLIFTSFIIGKRIAAVDIKDD